MSPLLKNLVIVLIVVLIAGGAYLVLKSDDSVTDGTASLSESEAVRQISKTLADTKRIDTFNIEGGVLGDVRFESLKKNDISFVLTDTETGRSNPFEKIQ